MDLQDWKSSYNDIRGMRLQERALTCWLRKAPTPAPLLQEDILKTPFLDPFFALSSDL